MNTVHIICEIRVLVHIHWEKCSPPSMSRCSNLNVNSPDQSGPRWRNSDEHEIKCERNSGSSFAEPKMPKMPHSSAVVEESVGPAVEVVDEVAK